MKHLPLLLVVALAGCTPESEPLAVGPAPEVTGDAPVLRRLTESQYEHALQDLFGDDVYIPDAPEPDLRAAGLGRIGASQVTISPRGVERYEAAAYVLAEQALNDVHRSTWMPCEPEGVTDDACAGQAMELLGRRAWRRPLADDELATLVALVNDASTTLGDFDEGLQFGIAALLQSPDFLMRPELGEPDPDAPGKLRYTGFEMASRLSFMLWDSIPDDALLDAAAAGDLDNLDGLTTEVDRMIADPRAHRGLRAWTDDLLNLGTLADIQKDPTVFVYLREGLFEAAREETLAGLEDLVFARDGDLRDLLTTRHTFLDRNLATLYGVPAPIRDGLGPTDLPEDGARAGLLGQAAILAQFAHPRSSSATKRGKFVRETLLCQTMPAPPAGVNTAIPEPSPDAPTLRDRIAVHLETPVCAACHKLMDPIGLALEQFDGIGVYRTTEADTQIDASGDLDGKKYDGLIGLARAIRAHNSFVPCMVNQVARAATGIQQTDEDEASYDWLAEKFAEEDFRLQALWRDLALSPMFRRVGEVQE